MVERAAQLKRLFHGELVGELCLLQLDADALSQLAVVAAPRPAENLHISRIRFEQPFENFDGRRFSSTVWTEKPETFAATDLERQAIDGNKVAVLLDQIGADDA